MARKKVNVSAAIREYLSANKATKPKEAAEALSAQLKKTISATLM
jgi:hypothetical protein